MFPPNTTAFRAGLRLATLAAFAIALVALAPPAEANGGGLFSRSRVVQRNVVKEQVVVKQQVIRQRVVQQPVVVQRVVQQQVYYAQPVVVQQKVIQQQSQGHCHNSGGGVLQFNSGGKCSNLFK
jgi:hypothetical protein